LVTVVPAGCRMKISAGPAVVGAGCWAKAAVLMHIANTVAGMIVFMTCGSRSLLERIADGILGTHPTAFLYLARRFLGGVPDGLFDGPFNLMSRTRYPIFVHIRSPRFPISTLGVPLWLPEAAAGADFS
jgi:hypothetical protein